MTTENKLQRHPIRGALYGLLLGLSAAYFAFFQFGLFGFDTLTGVLIKFGLIVLAGMVIGVVWALLAPPRRGRGPSEAPPPPAAA
ncbi:MAG: hypothetical protein HZA58_03405 [Acidimicrobiia bacterium]|nr:hypothetical protein [Acidimicrobiia bacterium]